MDPLPLPISQASTNSVLRTLKMLKCHGETAILDDLQHEQSWAQIQITEVEPAPKQAPAFIEPLLTLGELHDDQPAHFDTTVIPNFWFFEDSITNSIYLIPISIRIISILIFVHFIFILVHSLWLQFRDFRLDNHISYDQL